MELVLQDVSYGEELVHIDYVFQEDSIYFLNGLSGKKLYEVLTGKKKSSGSMDGLLPNQIGYVGDQSFKFNKKTLRDEFTYYAKELGKETYEKRMLDSLQMVGLNESLLDVKFQKLSHSELKRTQLALILFNNPKLLILDHFEIGFSYKEYKELLKLLQMIGKKYHKIFIFVSEDIETYLLFLTHYLVFKNGKIVCQGTCKELYNEVLYTYIEMPPIISFIKMIRDHNIKMENYLETKELIKGIFRDVENK